ncbi:DUF6192 family protein (plasmid) [Streptomyces sp. ITFR-21]|nr:DUF6192 family protein [Streptomyces sp. ITFR-21]WNI20210.1 DUF6192 family protein [Streptomyces sp. ITFR-21]
MRLSENGQGYSSPHSLRRSTEWGVSASVARVVGRGRPLVECAGRAGRSRAPAAALRAGLRPPWTVRPAPGPGWLSGGPSLAAPVRRSDGLWVGSSTEQVRGHPRAGGGDFQGAPSAFVAAAGRVVPGLRDRQLGDDERVLVHENVARVRATLDWIETAVDTGKVDVDGELARLLQGE